MPADPAALDGVTVLDLSSEFGAYAGRLLADLGADVIRIEPPGGDPARARPPFADDSADRASSLSWWYHNAGKRSVTIDLAQHDGLFLFRRLLPRADIVLESCTPSERAELDPQGALAEHPALVWVSSTAFGATGPHADWAATDLAVQAIAGPMQQAGYVDGPPQRIGGEQAAIAAGIAAAQGALIALLHAEATGEGQFVEISAQEVYSACQARAHLNWDFNRVAHERPGDAHPLPGIGAYAAADGHVYCYIGVAGFGAPWKALLDWMLEEGHAAELAAPERRRILDGLSFRSLVDPDTAEDARALLEPAHAAVDSFFAGKPAADIYHQGQARGLLIGIVNKPSDLLASEQLAARDWWQEIEQPRSLGQEPITARYPGPPYRLSATPARIRRPAPTAGGHNREVLTELAGIPAEDLPAYYGEGAI